MYQDFYGLSAPPFGITPDTEFFYANQSHQKALQTLAFALREGEGFVKVTGEVGTGKTLLVRMLLKELGDDFSTAWIPNPRMSDHSLWSALGDELAMNDSESATPADFHKRLGEHLVSLHKAGRPVVLVIDEAQAMGTEGLETVRLLTNLETEKRKLLQVVLFGQPELDELLARQEVRQLRQRITFSYRLSPLSRRAVREYLDHRLRRAGYNGAFPFTAVAVQRITRASGGVPRLVNIVAHKSLMLGYGRGRRRIGGRLVDLAVRDTEGASPGRGPFRLVAWSIALMVLTGVGVTLGVGLT
ncbi:MAG: ExeA family protein [Pseudomonadota bacterium]